MKRRILAHFVVLLVTAAVASAVTTVTLVPIEQGQPGSATNPLAPSDEILVEVTSDGGLVALDCILTITSGPATIVDAMGCDPSLPQYGWDPGYCFAPLFWPPVDPTEAEICASTFGVPPSGIVGWFLLHCDGPGAVTVELTPGTACGGSWDENFMLPNIFGTLEIHQVSEPTCWDEPECPCQPMGDATCDGTRNFADLFALKASFGVCAPWTDPQCCADFNHDGCVNFAEVYILKMGGFCPVEPSTGNQNCPP